MSKSFERENWQKCQQLRATSRPTTAQPNIEINAGKRVHFADASKVLKKTMKNTTVTPRATLDQMPSPNHSKKIGARPESPSWL